MSETKLRVLGQRYYVPDCILYCIVNVWKACLMAELGPELLPGDQEASRTTATHIGQHT